MLRKLLLIWLLALAATRPTHAQRTGHVVSSVPELLDSVRHIMAQEHIPGQLLVLATRDSVLFAGSLGEANVATHQPMTAHTLFRIGSVSKTFTALGLLQLVAQGKLRLTDEVRQLAPEVPIDNPWAATDPVRVVHVLEHTAGFDDLHFNHYNNHTATDPPALASLRLMHAELRCRWRPGERMAYSNVGYLVAGYLLEKRSHQPYDQYVTQHLLRPLGMPDAVATPRPAALPQLAQGYVYADGRYVPQQPLSFYDVAAGDMNASAADMALRAVLPARRPRRRWHRPGAAGQPARDGNRAQHPGRPQRPACWLRPGQRAADLARKSALSGALRQHARLHFGLGL